MNVLESLFRGVRARCAIPVWMTGLTIYAAAQAATGTGETFQFTYVGRSGDAIYEPTRAYTGLRLRDRYRPVDGARAAARESGIIGRAIGVTFELSEMLLEPDADVGSALQTLADQGASVFLLDLPREDVVEISRTYRDRNRILFNIRHTDDSLRAEDCSPVLFHTMPSRSMLTDAIAQFLKAKGWNKILVLTGESEEDDRFSESFRRSVRKFGLHTVDVRDFVLGQDPRKRDLNNIALLTAGADHDAVFLADAVGEFGRYVPYNTQSPRPVVGSEGLQAGAWHWTWERHGAPQLNQRFDKTAGRTMTDTDYAAWIALRSVVEAISRIGSTDIAEIRKFLVSDDFTLDTYKGLPGGFRPWDHQLRQAILLYRHNAVIAHAPLDGFLHEKNHLDTLGVDQRESDCQFD